MPSRMAITLNIEVGSKVVPVACYASVLDGTILAPMMCEGCGNEYEEAVYESAEVILGIRKGLCLQCDPEAEEPALLMLV